MKFHHFATLILLSFCLISFSSFGETERNSIAKTEHISSIFSQYGSSDNYNYPNETIPNAIVIYDWPTDASIVSDKYTMRARSVAGSDFGPWVDVQVFNHLPRNYPDHPVYGDDAMAPFMQDRTMSFVQMSFEGRIEVEVTKLYGTNASSVEVSPKALAESPHFFDGKVTRFVMNKPSYLSVNFVSADNKDDDRYGGNNIKNGMMVFADYPEEVIGDYTVPDSQGAGVVIWDKDLDIETLRDADILYFPPGNHKMKEHKDNNNTDIYDQVQMLGEPLYHGQLRLKKSQKIYVAGGAYVQGSFRSNGIDNVWLYGRGIITGRDHWMHEIIKPTATGEYILNTQGKEAFIDFIGSDNAHIEGVVIKEPYHHTCPSGKNGVIRRIKILGFCYNNDGIRTGDNTVVDNIFIKSNDDYDYAWNLHEVKNSIFWPCVNGAVGMLSWSTLGSGFADYHNNYYINSEWSTISKRNSGIIGSQADDGIKLQDNLLENLTIEHPIAYLVNITLEQVGSLESGWIKDFEFNNILVEYPFSLPNGTPVKQRISGLPQNIVTGFVFNNLVVNGVPVTWDNHTDYFDLNLTGINGANSDPAKYVENISFNQTGTFYEISLTSNAGGSFSPSGSSGVVKVPEGMSQTIAFIPSAGKEISEVLLDGVSVGVSNHIKLADIDANHIIEVTYIDGDGFYDLSIPKVDFSDAITNLISLLNGAGESSMTISWNEPSNPNVAVSGYYISISESATIGYPIDGTTYTTDLDLGDGNGYQFVVNGTTSVTFQSLKSNTTYYVNVFTSSGNGSSIDYLMPSLTQISKTTDEAPASYGDVLISEIMYNNKSGNTDRWFELYNTTAAQIDLSGWVLTYDSNYPITSGYITLPSGTRIDPNEFLVFTARGFANPELASAIVVSGFIWGTVRTEALLATALEGGTAIDGILGVDAPRISGSGNGISIERVIPAVLAFDDPNAWRVSTTPYTDINIDYFDFCSPGTSGYFLTWNGASWSNAVGPNQNETSVIAGNYTGSGFTTKDLIVVGLKELVISSGTLDVKNDLLISGQMTLNSGATLLTYDGSLCQGTITIERQTRFSDGRYSMVGTPLEQSSTVTGQLLGSNVYRYNEQNNYDYQEGLLRWETALSDELEPGIGYTQSHKGLISFTGVPNDGVVNVAISHTASAATNAGDRGWNLVSNPYAAPIDVTKFLIANSGVIDNSVSIWDDGGSDNGRGTNGDYLVANSIGATNAPNSGTFDGYLASMQGFFVRATSPTSSSNVQFTESMRETVGNNDSFFRRQGEQPHIKIALIGEEFNETLIGFRDDATLGFDLKYDAIKISGNPEMSFYSKIGYTKLAIQGLPKLENEMSIPLEYNLAEAGLYEVKVTSMFGVTENFDLYLVYQSESFDLSKSVTLPLAAGIGAFSLQLRNTEALSISQNDNLDVFRNDNQLNLRFGTIDRRVNLAVFDISGKVLFQEADSELNLGKWSQEVSLTKGQVYVLKVTGVEGSRTVRFIY